VGAWLDLLDAATEPPLWLEDTAYSARLLVRGVIPWLNTTSLVNFKLKAFALLKPSVFALDVGLLVAAFSTSKVVLGSAAPPPAPIEAFEALLSNEELKRHVSSVLLALRQSVRAPLALCMPSPRAWPAKMASGNESPPLGSDEVDQASLIMASFLRSFAGSAADSLLLNDDAASQPTSTEQLEQYQSVVNVGRHYGWDLGFRVPTTPVGRGDFDFLVAPKGECGVDVGDAFSGPDAPLVTVPQGGFLFAQVPERATPELVMQRLAILRRQ
jgi:hypothetical protein